MFASLFRSIGSVALAAEREIGRHREQVRDGTFKVWSPLAVGLLGAEATEAERSIIEARGLDRLDRIGSGGGPMVVVEG